MSANLWDRTLAADIEKRFPFLTVDINEGWPATGPGDAKRTTQYAARTCHVFVGILVDDYGQPDTSGASPTEVEFEAARSDSREKMLVFLQSTLDDEGGKIFKKQPLAYQTLIRELKAYRGDSPALRHEARAEGLGPRRAQRVLRDNPARHPTVPRVRECEDLRGGRVGAHDLQRTAPGHDDRLAEGNCKARRGRATHPRPRVASPTGPGDRHARFRLAVEFARRIREIL